jgi:hypothetical protein
VRRYLVLGALLQLKFLGFLSYVQVSRRHGIGSIPHYLKSYIHPCGPVTVCTTNLAMHQTKAVILTALALGLLSVVAAQAVTQTFYTDPNCATQAGASALGPGTSNPLVMPLSQCAKYYIGYINWKSCGSGIASGTMYLDQSCTQQLGSPQSPVGTCAQTQGLTGIGSTKITCSAAASPTLAFIAVVSSAIALLL